MWISPHHLYHDAILICARQCKTSCLQELLKRPGAVRLMSVLIRRCHPEVHWGHTSSHTYTQLPPRSAEVHSCAIAHNCTQKVTNWTFDTQNCTIVYNCTQLHICHPEVHTYNCHPGVCNCTHLHQTCHCIRYEPVLHIIHILWTSVHCVTVKLDGWCSSAYQPYSVNWIISRLNIHICMSNWSPQHNIFITLCCWRIWRPHHSFLFIKTIHVSSISTCAAGTSEEQIILSRWLLSSVLRQRGGNHGWRLSHLLQRFRASIKRLQSQPHHKS